MTRRRAALSFAIALAACAHAQRPTTRQAVNLAAHALAEYDEQYTAWFTTEIARAEMLRGLPREEALNGLAEIEGRYYAASQAAYAALVAARVAIAEGKPVGDDLDAAVRVVGHVVAELASGGD